MLSKTITRRFEDSRYLFFTACLVYPIDIDFPLLSSIVGKWVGIVRFRFLSFSSFSVSGKVSPITPLLSGVLVRRAFRAYFGRISGGSRKAYISLV